MPLEKIIVGKIVKMAERHGWYAVKVHGGPMQKAGLPDLLMLKRGRAVFLEVKQPGLGKKSDPTPLQVRRMAELPARGGCDCFVVRSVDFWFTSMEHWRVKVFKTKNVYYDLYLTCDHPKQHTRSLMRSRAPSSVRGYLFKNLNR